MKNKISLIGMPSVGKSTISKYIAEKIGFNNIDLDSLVEEREGTSLINILNEKGGQYFLDMEYSFLQNIVEDDQVVISTAGSMIYHEKSMEWLKDNSIICLLVTDIDILKKRQEESPKAVVGLKEKGMDKLYEERKPLYEKWADFVVDVTDKEPEEIANEIVGKLSSEFNAVIKEK